LYEPKDIASLIKELYEKPTEKKDTRKSLNRLMSCKATPAKKIAQL
jgi:hypothetical protein